ncbi:Eukaryotic translation initiation factor 4 gamma 2, partial [Hypsibius exemplaris]
FLPKEFDSGKTDNPAITNKDRSRDADSANGSFSRLTGSPSKVWCPPSLARQRNGGGASEQDRLEAIQRGIRSLLNKLTPENFERVSTELTATALKSEAILTTAIDLIFRKALEEPQYNSLYAQLCRRLSDNAPNKDIFKRVLFTEVQNAYMRRLGTGSDPKVKGVKDESHRRKQEHLSNVKFIGELGKLDLLHGQILHVCIQELLDRKSSASIADKAEDLECLCQMMRIIGNSLDSRVEDKFKVDDYIAALRDVSNDPALPSRIRFLCLDVVELRSNKWIPRRIHQANAPKTIIEVREEIRQEIGANKEVDTSLRLSPMHGMSNMRQPSSPRTVAEKQQEKQNGILPHVRFTNSPSKEGYNRGGSGNQNQSAQKSGQGNRLGDGRKSVLKVLGQQMPDGQQEFLLRPVTSFNPQRPPQKVSETLYTLKNPIPSANRPTPSLSSTTEDFHARAEKSKHTKQQASTLSKAEVNQSVTDIITAYFDNAKDRNSVATSIKELNCQKRFKPDLVSLMLKMGMERGEVNREKLSELITYLTCESWLTDSDVTEGFERLLEALDSGACDPKPCMAAYLADLIVSGILSFKSSLASFERGQHFPLAFLCLQRLEQLKGSDFLSEHVNREKMDLLKWFSDKDLKLGADHVVSTLNIYGLTYLCPSYRLQAQLGKLLEDGVTPADLDRVLQENQTTLLTNQREFIYNVMFSLVRYVHYQSIASDNKPGGGGDAAMEQTRISEDKFKKLIVTFKVSVYFSPNSMQRPASQGTFRLTRKVCSLKTSPFCMLFRLVNNNKTETNVTEKRLGEAS